MKRSVLIVCAKTNLASVPAIRALGSTDFYCAYCGERVKVAA